MKKEYKNDIDIISIIEKKCFDKNYMFLGFNDKYINQNSKIKLRCNKDGFEWSPTFHSFIKVGTNCHRCNKKEIKSEYNILVDINKRCNELNYTFIKFDNNIFKNIKNKIELRCSNNHISKPSIDNFLNKKSKCSECIRSLKLTKDIFIKEIKEMTLKNNHTYLSMIGNFKYSLTNIELKCNTCGNLWSTTYFNYINKKTSCRKCLKLKKLTYDEIISNIEKKCLFRNYNFIGFKNSNGIKSEIILKCKNDHKFISQYSNFIHQNNGCPVCKESKGEVIIRNFLKENDIKFNSQKTFEGCKNKRKLRFDFYLPDHNLCIEFDGIQHYKNIIFNGHEVNFNYIQNNDKIKNEYCFKNNIRLLRIKYDSNILKILNDYFLLS